MEIEFLGTGSGQPSIKRNVASIALKLLNELNEVWLFDVGEATQHQLLKTNIRPRKINKIFISHMHGDHVLGLPGFLISRSFHGSEKEKLDDLTIYGPPEVKKFVNNSINLTKSHLSYNIKFEEVKDGKIFENEKFLVYSKKLNHNLDSYGFRIEQKNIPGRLKVEKLLELGVPEGPIFGKIKKGIKVEFNGSILDPKDFIGEPVKGKVITLISDTKKSNSIEFLSKNADYLIHEATFNGKEGTLAKKYFHSTSIDATNNANKYNVKHLILNHISPRYIGKSLEDYKKEARKNFKNTIVSQDLMELEIK